MKKRIVQWSQRSMSVLLVLSMLFTSVPVQAFAAEAPYRASLFQHRWSSRSLWTMKRSSRRLTNLAAHQRLRRTALRRNLRLLFHPALRRRHRLRKVLRPKHRKAAACRPAVQMRSRPETAAQPRNPSPRRIRLPLSRNPQVFPQAPVK